MSPLKTDTVDRHLLYLLHQNSRASLTDLASELGCSRETVNYRIANLCKSGVIRSFVTKMDFGRLGLANYAIYLKLKNLTKDQYAVFIKKLQGHKNVAWIASLGGRFDLTIEMSAHTPRELDSRFSALQDLCAGNINDHYISTWVSQYLFGKKYLWPEKINLTEATRGQYLSSPTIASVDKLDSRILAAMANNARMPLAELGRHLKVPPTTVSFRLRELERKGVIKGYTLLSHLQDFGYSKYKMLLRVRNFSKKDEAQLVSFCATHPNVYYCGKTFGNWDFEIEADVQTPVEYQQFLIQLRSRFESIIYDIESLPIFEEHLLTFWTE